MIKEKNVMVKTTVEAHVYKGIREGVSWTPSRPVATQLKRSLTVTLSQP